MKKIFIALSVIMIFSFSCLFGQKYDLSTQPVLYVVGYAHLDTQWRWDYQTTIEEYIWNTMADNFRLFEKYPDYVFNFSGANRYKMMKEYYPEAYEKVKKYVAAGRWFPAGSSMEENDVLSPSYESLIRQILLGGDYFRKEFGVNSSEFILPDCFGFPYSLPSVLAHCGIKGFSTQKLTWGSAVGIPFNFGKWIGPDGESIVASLNPGDYTARIRADLNNSVWTNRVLEAGKKYGVNADYMYFGTGDVGGAPAEESVAWLEKSMQNPGKVKIISATSSQMFDDITPQLKDKLPVYKGELLLTNHSAGSISSAGFMKRWNRKNELLAYKAEASSVIGGWLGATKYNSDKMNEAWRLVMGAQFHDILPGTSIPRAYDFAQNDEIVATNQFSGIFADESGAIIRALDTKVKGVPVVVFNPLSFEREDCVEANVTFTEAPKDVKVFDNNGREIPSQIISTDGNKVKVLFLAKTGSVSYTVFDVRPSDKPCKIATGLKATKTSLENAKYLVKFNSDGDISSIYDKTAKKELLQSPIRLAFQYEKPQDYPAWNMDWADRKNPPTGYVDGAAKMSIVENGPARVAIQVEREARNSKFVQVVRLSAEGNSDRVEFNTKIDWAAQETCLKATFPLTVANEKATYNVGVGTIERKNNDSLKFEVPSQQWFDLTDKKGNYGVSILDDCKYGSDKPTDNTVRLTLLYTPGIRGYYTDQAVQEFGRHEMLYALYGHKGDWKEGNSNKQALRINQPLIAFQAPAHDGLLGNEFSFVEINNDNVVLSALKKAETSDEIIVRFLETKGEKAEGVKVTFASDVISAKEVTGQELPLGSAEIKGGKLAFDLTPYHLKTFAIKLKPAEKGLTAGLFVPVELPYNIDVISNDKQKSDGNFGENGKTYPAEMLPETIVSDNISFKVGPKEDGKNNAVACTGQVIKLPEGNYNKLYILAASADRATKGTFKIGDKTFEINVEYWSGFLGQWDRRNWEGIAPNETNYDRPGTTFTGLTPSYVRKDNVAFFTTHRHARDGQNEAYVYTYIYKYKIDLPQGAKEITLPVNDKIKILAMTAAYNENDDAVPAQNLYDDLNKNKEEYTRFNTTAKPQIIPEKGYIQSSGPLVVVMSAKDDNAEIHYTTDGTVPTMQSSKYSEPIPVSQTISINAISFAKGKLPSAMVTGLYSASLPVKNIVYNLSPSQRRSNWDKMLYDLMKGSADNGDRRWQQFEKVDVDVVLDLGAVKNVSEVNIGFLVDNNERVFLPGAVTISVSNDNANFTQVVDTKYTVPAKPESLSVKRISFNVNTETQYIRIVLNNIGKVPEKFNQAGANAIIKVDEITVK